MRRWSKMESAISFLGLLPAMSDADKLANESSDLDDEQIWGWLTAFIDRIVDRMPNGYPISLAGAVVSRDEQTITSTYEEAKSLKNWPVMLGNKGYMQEIMQKYGHDAGFYSAMNDYLEALKNINFTDDASSVAAKQELENTLEQA